MIGKGVSLFQTIDLILVLFEKVTLKDGGVGWWWWGPLSTREHKANLRAGSQISSSSCLEWLNKLHYEPWDCLFNLKCSFFVASGRNPRSCPRARFDAFRPFTLSRCEQTTIGSSLWEGLGAYCPSNWTLELLVFLDWTITRRCAVSVKPRLKAPSRGVKRCSLAVRSAVFLDQTLLGNAVLWNRSRLTCLEGPPPPPPFTPPCPSPSHSETRLSLFKPSLNDTNRRSRHV